MSTKIEPCPVCGKEPSWGIENYPGHAPVWKRTCNVMVFDGDSHFLAVRGKTKSVATRRWNEFVRVVKGGE